MAENKGMLSELNLEVKQKTDRLAEVELRLKDCLAEKAQEEERLSRRLRDSHETIASLRAQSPPIKVSLRRWPRAGPLPSWPLAPRAGPRRAGGLSWSMSEGKWLEQSSQVGAQSCPSSPFLLSGAGHVVGGHPAPEA